MNELKVEGFERNRVMMISFTNVNASLPEFGEFLDRVHFRACPRRWRRMNTLARVRKGLLELKGVGGGDETRVDGGFGWDCME